ncbi:MAG: ABC transporter permease [Chloroflexi bacterium]|nr:ABC transporter permease [Chloroflexota bacterium]
MSQQEILEQQVTPPASEDEKVYVASQAQLVWWRFRKHKVALGSAILLIVLYTIIILADFLGPYEPRTNHVKYIYAPPAKIHLRDAEGRFVWPFVYATVGEMDPNSLRVSYVEDKSQRFPIGFFVPGEKYKFLGLFETNVHFIGVAPGGTLFLTGTDGQGRDMFSRILAGGRISLSIGLVGIAMSFFLGILIGGLSGYYGGLFDTVTQRVIELIRGVPDVPLWMALSAALPPKWPVTRVYFGIVIILSLIGWTGLARVVRGKFMSLREEDFVMSARLAGASEVRIVFRHMVPSFTSHLIASITMSVPGMILGETSLSFLGLGLRPPAISWGVLLAESQKISVLAESPWLLLPAIPIIIVVLAFNFMGDGIRDAADPYSR